MNTDFSKALDACLEYKAEISRLKEENEVLKAEVDQWAARCAAAIWMLPESVTGKELIDAQNKWHNKVSNLERENANLQKDRERLDWIQGESTGERWERMLFQYDCRTLANGNIRAAIDAAKSLSKS